MEQFVLVKPTSEYASQIAEYRQEFLDADDSIGWNRNLSEELKIPKNI